MGTSIYNLYHIYYGLIASPHAVQRSQARARKGKNGREKEEKRRRRRERV
jgi:hypothetical protein